MGILIFVLIIIIILRNKNHMTDLSNVEKYDIIENAIKKKKIINIKYRKNELFGDTTYRKIKPIAIGRGNMFSFHEIKLRKDRIYVHAYCKLRKEERIFLLDNITILKK